MTESVQPPNMKTPLRSSWPQMVRPFSLEANPRVTSPAKLVSAAGEAQTKKEQLQFCVSLDRRLADLRTWVVSEIAHVREASQHGPVHLKEQVCRRHQNSPKAIPSTPVGNHIMVTRKAPAGSELLIAGPKVRSSNGHWSAPTQTEPQLILANEWANEVTDLEELPKPEPERLVDATLSHSVSQLDNAFHMAVVRRWVDLVCKLNTPKHRFAKMRRYVARPVWINTNRLSVASTPQKEQHELPWSVAHTNQSLASRVQTTIILSNMEVNLPLVALQSCMLNPDSAVHIFWVILCCMMIVYDIAMVPIITFFNVDEQHDLFATMSWLSPLFWSLDIVINFTTGTYIGGVLETRLAIIAIVYAKSWLFFDLMIVLSQWLTLLVNSKATSMNIVVRGLRLIRLLRLSNARKLQLELQRVLRVQPEAVIVMGKMFKIVFILSIIIHIHGCLWYGVGRLSSNGWAFDDKVVSNSVLHNYILSLQWAATQVHGVSQVMPLTTFEHSFATASSWLGMFFFSYLVGHATLTVLQFNNVSHWKTQAACSRFCKSHKIPHILSIHMQHYLDLGHAKIGLSEQVKEDADMLSTLPASLREDVVHEARWPLLKATKVFRVLKDLHERTARTICQAAITVSVTLQDVIVFEAGDPGKSVFIVQFGKMQYQVAFERSYPAPSDSVVRSPSSRMDALLARHLPGVMVRASSSGHAKPQAKTLERGSFLCEAVLWTKWEHMGEFRAICDSTMLLLDPETFAEIVQERAKVLHFAALYASKFVIKLNQMKKKTDLFGFKLNTETMSEEDEFDEEKHFVFLSHYKAEAGTEATLMHEALSNMISSDVNSPAFGLKNPVFLDSANLEDLSQLRREVANSCNFVLLLTPGVLSRPWCLLEIATAWKQNAHIVPVEVQRSGMSFQYPDEAFYQKLVSGKMLTKGDEQLLADESLTLSDIAASIRQVFTHIALPFSPHKSGRVRQAELSDILTRCMNSVGSSRSLSIFTKLESSSSEPWQTSTSSGRSYHMGNGIGREYSERSES